MWPRPRPFQGKFFTLGWDFAVFDPLAKFKQRRFIHSINTEGGFKIFKRVTWSRPPPSGEIFTPRSWRKMLSLLWQGQTHGRPCRHTESALSTGDGLWPLPRHMWWRSREVAAFARLCVFGELCVDIVTIGTPMVIFAVLTVFWLFLTNGTLYQSSKTLKTIGVPIVTGLPRLYQQCTNRQKQSKTVKTQSKQHKNDQS